MAVLGVSGSVAAYRAADLARELMRHGFTVRVCLTDAASQFVSPALFEALTGQPCLQSVFEEPERGRMAHIDWARAASVIVVAPATANTLAKLAWGMGDDMLTTLALASTAPLVLAPAMNPHMYTHAETQEALLRLREKGAFVVEPTEGDVACGENGQGKLASIPAIVAAVDEVVGLEQLLKGQRVLITSGPTQEPIDLVRYVSNRSSGKMGAALARAALLLGAEVTVVSGPTSIPLPLGAKVVRVRTAQEMLQAALAELPGADWVIGAAAVADYRPANPSETKLRRNDEALVLELHPNPDIIATLVQQAGDGVKVVGFAAEPDDDTAVALEKLGRKRLFALAVNDVSSAEGGFEVDVNALKLLLAGSSGVRDSGARSKFGCALWLWRELCAVNR